MKIIKKTTRTLAFALALGLILFACDETPPALQKESGVPADSSALQKVVLEDYTGFNCGNCPKAHEEIDRLKKIYGDKLIVLAVHSGIFAMPTPKYPYDFRTEAGTEWSKFFGNAQSDYPNGMVDRMGFPEGEHILKPDAFERGIKKALEKKPIATLEVAPIYVKSSRQIVVFVSYNYLRELPRYHNLSVVITEDSVIQHQTDYRKNPKDIENYVHMHVLRKAINGVWGDKLTFPSGTKIYKYTIPENSDWKPEHLNVIAFIHDKGGTYEILAADEKPLF